MLLALGALAIVAVAVATWFFALREDPYEFHGGFFEPPSAAAELDSAVDQHGEPFRLEDWRGKVVFLYFGYTHCPDACPATLDEFMEVKDELGAEAEDVAFVFVTVDPSRDTPERMTEYLGFWDPEFYGLSMPEEETQQVARAWNILYTYREANSQGGYLVDHETSSFVVDKEGNLRLTYPLGFDSEKMAEDIQYLLDE
jgi:protein SCO1/2